VSFWGVFLILPVILAGRAAPGFFSLLILPTILVVLAGPGFFWFETLPTTLAFGAAPLPAPWLLSLFTLPTVLVCIRISFHKLLILFYVVFMINILFIAEKFM
jgi:hypothetical protein